MNDDDTRVGHVKQDHFDTVIGRDRADGELRHMNNTPVGEPGWIGNPYRMEDGYTREEAVQKFRRDFEARLESDPEFRRAVEALRGDVLGCWCRSLNDAKPMCHGDVIRDYLDLPRNEYLQKTYRATEEVDEEQETLLNYQGGGE